MIKTADKNVPSGRRPSPPAMKKRPESLAGLPGGVRVFPVALTGLPVAASEFYGAEAAVDEEAVLGFEAELDVALGDELDDEEFA